MDAIKLHHPDLFKLIQTGSRKAFEELFRTYYNPLVRFANEIVKDVDTAEDLVQEVFVKFWERRERIEIQSSIKAYLYMAVKNHCFNKLKLEQRYAYMEEDDSDYKFPSSEQTSTKVESFMLSENITKSIEALPPKCSLIFKMSRFEDKTYQEIAEILGISIKTVENQMGKALMLMRKNLAHYLPVSILILFEKIFF